MGEVGDCQDKKRCHELHLCKLVKREDLEEIRKLVKAAVFLCKKCGRVAREQDNLCDPERI